MKNEILNRLLTLAMLCGLAMFLSAMVLLPMQERPSGAFVATLLSAAMSGTVAILAYIIIRWRRPRMKGNS